MLPVPLPCGHHLVDTICSPRLLRSPFPHSSSEVFEHSHGALPVYARICNGDALLQTARTLGGHLLVALVDVGLDHDAYDAGLAFAELVGDGLGYLGLVAVVFVGVS